MIVDPISGSVLSSQQLICINELLGFMKSFGFVYIEACCQHCAHTRTLHTNNILSVDHRETIYGIRTQDLPLVSP